jgi:phosphoglycolate phosphatase-like HAD superfamily hydrolase
VGDTPRDVAAARANGCRCVAVATGHYDVAELREAGATVVLPDLTDRDATIAAIVAH